MAKRKLILDVTAPAQPPDMRRVKRRVTIKPIKPAEPVAGQVAWIRHVQQLELAPKPARPKNIDGVHKKHQPLHATKLHSRTQRAKTLRRSMPHPLRPNSNSAKPTRPGANQNQSNKTTQPLISDVVPQPRRRRKFTLFLLPTAAVLLFAVGIGFLWQSQQKNNFVDQATEQVAGATDGEGQRGPQADENPPPDISSYQVAPDMPRVLRIPSLGVEARIMPMGILPSGELEAPFNIYDAGWYNQSSKPGKHGAMLVDGHVHGPTKPGIFYGLKDIADGATVEVERGDGQVFSYKVVAREQTPYAETNMNKALVSAKQGTPGLNLITCTGSYNQQGDYEERLVVYTVLQ